MTFAVPAASASRFCFSLSNRNVCSFRVYPNGSGNKKIDEDSLETKQCDVHEKVLQIQFFLGRLVDEGTRHDGAAVEKLKLTLSFQPVLDVVSDKAYLEGLQPLKRKVDVPRSSYVEAASNVISEYLAAGAIGVVDEPLEKQKKCIAYHFGVSGPGGRNRTDGTPYSWDKKEIQRKLATREMQERMKDLVQRGVVDEVDPRFRKPKT